MISASVLLVVNVGHVLFTGQSDNANNLKLVNGEKHVCPVVSKPTLFSQSSGGGICSQYDRDKVEQEKGPPISLGTQH